MQSLKSYRDTSYLSLGERRGKSDLARFSLDLSWARAVSDGARSRAYPSPPMSGSPPLPHPRGNPGSSDRGQESYGPGGQEVLHRIQTPQSEHSDTRGPMLRTYQPGPLPSATFPPYIELAQPLAYQQQQQHQHQQRPQLAPQMVPHQPHSFSQQPPQPPQPFTTPDRPPTGESSDFSSPKTQRKTKGHVASACVPCKRAHLRCDAQRPCSRCTSNGKEDACVDVQHKKRGRPRLRDEREQRFDMSQGFAHPPDPSGMRRPLSLYAPGEGTMSAGYSEGLQRSGSYRILKSTPSYPIAPRNLEHASARDANMYGMPGPGPRMIQTQEPLCAFLTMDMHVVKATTTFSETIATPMIIGRKLLDIVSGSDREKVARLQRILEEERRQRDPTYLPPIYARMDEQTHIQSVPFALDEMGMGRSDHQEMFIFPGAEGQHRAIPARLTLAKKESTYFIVMFLALPQTPQTPQAFQQPSLSPYTRESYSRESQSQYGFQPGPQPYVQSQGPPFVANPGYANSRPESMSYRAPAPPGQNAPFPASMPPFAATPARSEYPPHQNPFETTPRSELGQSQPQRQHDLQLPPIRDQRGEQSSMGSAPRRDDRSSRVDIGGLLEKPHGPGR